MTAPHPRTAHAGGDLRILRAAMFAAVCVVLAAGGHTLASCATVPLWTLGAGFLGALVVVAPLAGRARSLPGIAATLAVCQTVLHTLFGLAQHGTGATASGGAMPGSMGPMTSMASMGSMPAMSDATLVERAARLVCGTTAAAISPTQAYRILVDARVYTGPAPAVMHHPAQALPTAPTADPALSLLPSLPMLLGHVLAALAAGWLLRRGDLALLRLIRLSAHEVADTASVRSLRAALALARALHAGLPTTPEAGPHCCRTTHPVPPAPTTTALRHSVVRRGPPAAPFLTLAA
ncbi:hypothetical protein ACF1A5_29395 [Streptomyces sp. NPDC014864]|uniref:hypothetical protein n=1 Tax=Streptomyces sp. NPDC014864 TaxID=3364924 RepID=UPI0036FC8B2E